MLTSFEIIRDIDYNVNVVSILILLRIVQIKISIKMIVIKLLKCGM